jgi:diguanylate cyclase (GGDEF)-like protein/PAS domain S-box-containing protein
MPLAPDSTVSSPCPVGWQQLASLRSRPLPVDRFLPIAIGICDALIPLQATEGCHGRLNPAAIEVCPPTLQVRLVPPGPPPPGMAAVLPYLAPEQHGRMGRRVDARSDCYAFGVICYELLTGALPFQAHDPLEWMHAHLARMPPPPHLGHAAIPQPLSDIVMKMLDKAPERRYQGAAGLRADLEHCWRAWRATGAIAPFAIGRHDSGGMLRTPHRLYGRDAERALLHAACRRVATLGASELVLLSGPAGVGKSALVEALARQILAEGGTLIAGKFDQDMRRTPFAAAAGAFSQLVDAALAGDDETLRGWRARLLDALGGNGALLFDVLPRLRLLLGDQPPPPSLPAREAQRRFFAALRAFMATFAGPGRALVVFLDDLQWADDDTLDFLAFLLAETRTPHVLVIGASRDVAPGPSPLTRAVDRIRAAGVPVADVPLAPLAAADLVPLVANVLGATPHRVRPLAALVHRKTAGIPLFALHFLDRLVREGLLRCEPDGATWHWDIDEIQAQAYSDNVIDLMIDSLQLLAPGPALQTLQYAACLGHVVSLSLLAGVCGGTVRDVRRALGEPLRAGFVELADADTLRFVHDRIRQAVHTLIPRERRGIMHLEIARKLHAEDAAAGAGHGRVFDVADQFNLGSESVVTDDERRVLVAVNLRAGTEAKGTGAHAAAAHYLDMGLRSVRPGDIDMDYATVATLYYEQASCYYLLGRADDAARLLDTLLAHARGLTDRARALHLKIELLSARADNAGALAALRECMTLFGMVLPDDATTADALAEEARFWSALGARPIAALADVTSRTGDDACEFLLDSLLIATPQANVYSAPLFDLVVAHAANLSLQHGSPGEAALSYALLGAICCGRDDIARARELEDVALRLVHGAGQPVPGRYRAPALLVTGALLAPHTRPLPAALADLHDAFETGVRSDEPVAASLACEYIVEQRHATGAPLADVRQEIQVRSDYIGRTAYTPSRRVMDAWRTFTGLLLGPSPEAHADGPDGFDARMFERDLDGATASPAHFVGAALALQACYLFGDHDGALRAAARAVAFERFAPGTILRAEVEFYRALAAAARYHAAPADDLARQDASVLVRAACERFGTWRTQCPDNHAACHHLLCAERARIGGDRHAAMDEYTRAIETAAAQGAVHLGALAHELAAGFCRDGGAGRLAETLLAAAIRDYDRWGAHAKADWLRRRHPDPDAAVPRASPTAADLDLAAMAKAAQAIANEVTTGRVHETLLRTLMEHVGADGAHLVVWDGDTLRLRESARYGDDRFEVEDHPTLPPVPDCVPGSIVQYVARARTPLTLGDACQEGMFVHDPYFRGMHQCAVLCLPILRQQDLAGVLYLENTRLAGAFARVNLRILEWLLAQVAISLDNAALYENLQESQTRLATVMDYVPACVYMKDLEARYLFVNREFEKTFGVSLEDTLHKTDFDHFADTPELAEAIRRTDMIALRDGTISIEENLVAADGLTHTFLSVKTPLYGNSDIKGLCGISMDISEQKRARERIDYLAHYDVLTGLPNRHLLHDRLGQAIAQARSRAGQVGVMVLDLDRFKVINDSLGHQAGDRLLQEVAERLKTCVEASDTVGRLGGDEFAVIATGAADSGALRQIATRIIDSLALPFRLDGRDTVTGACIGISVFPQDAGSAETLLQYADLAMYHAKEHGHKALRFYNDAMDMRAQERMSMESELRAALANDELFLLYQPQVDMLDRHVTGAEALVRWRHPVKGIISPAVFIPLAEECGLISEITQWAIDEACARLHQWRDAGLPAVTLAVNVSALNVHQDDLFHAVETALAANGLGGACLELEMTEGTLMKDFDASIDKLVALKRLGIHVSIDDFGTGYSSLSYLKRLPVDKLKIDQSFVRDIARDPNDAAITGAIIALGKQLNLKVIAEGVEDVAAENFLRRHRCDLMQGYLFSPPISADAFTRMLS